MGVAFEVLLDEQASNEVARLRQALRSAGIQGVVPDAEFRPHLTVAYVDQGSEAAIESTLQTMIQKLPPLAVQLNGVLLFTDASRPTSVVGLGVTPSAELLAFHRAAFELAAGAHSPIGVFCHPDGWTPHCSIADRVSHTELPRALDILRGELKLPLAAHAVAMLAELDSGRVVRLDLKPRPITVDDGRDRSIELCC